MRDPSNLPRGVTGHEPEIAGYTEPEPVTPAWVREYIENLLSPPFDDEKAHGDEDALHQAVLQAIADGSCTDPQECARLALTTQRLNFSRWYA